MGRGVVTARERHDWVKAGVALRRRAEMISAAVERVKALESHVEFGETPKEEATTSGADGGMSSATESSEATEACTTRSSGGENSAEGDQTGIDFVERVLRARAAIESMQSEQDDDRTARLAEFVANEIDAIRQAQRETYSGLAREETAMLKFLKDFEARIDAQTPTRSTILNNECRVNAKDTGMGAAQARGTPVVRGDETPAAVAAYDDFIETHGPTGGVRLSHTLTFVIAHSR